MKHKVSLALVLALAATVVTAGAAQADEVKVDHEIAYALSVEPGGYATGAHSAYWPELGMTMTSSLAVTTLSVGSCSTGTVCAYSGYSLTGAKLSWSGCSTYSTAALPSVGSIADARSSGKLQA